MRMKVPVAKVLTWIVVVTIAAAIFVAFATFVAVSF